MTDYFEFLLDGNEIKDVAALSTQEQFDTFKRLKFLAMLKIKDSNLVARHSALKFICGNLNSEIHKMTTPQVRFDVDQLSYKDCKVEIENLIDRLSKDRKEITITNVCIYNDLAKRSNQLVQQLLDLSGEFRCYYEGEMVVRRPII